MTTLRELIDQHCENMTDYEAIAAALNAPTVIDNPQTEPYAIPDPPTLEDVLGVVPSAERVKIRALSGYVDDVRRAIDTQNALYMATLIEDALTALPSARRRRRRAFGPTNGWFSMFVVSYS